MIGKKLGPYQITEKLGEGGMGVVYKAHDTRLGRTVALKVLPPGAAADPERRRRFEQEARAVAALNHPHICTLHDIGREGDTDYLVMEFLDGQTLAARLAKGALLRAQALEYAVQIAQALARAHSEGIIHRDLKPGNVIITESGVKLLDFGLAKLDPVRAPAAALSSLPTREVPITGQGTIVGTLAYMAPEQLEGKDVDARTDLFAVGALLYEMLTGRRAFEGASRASLITAIMSSDPPPLTSIEPLTPPALDRLVMKCLAKDPRARWQSAADLADELRWISTGSGSSGGRSAPAAEPSSRRMWPRLALAGGIVIIIVLAVAAGWWLLRDHEAPSSSGKSVGSITSLAVKPLDDYSGDTTQAYLSDGMTDALCAALGNISALRVPGRSTVMRYKRGQKSIQEMARELNVDAIVEGSLQRAGSRILVTVKLIEAATDRQIWADKFEGDLSDFFKVQSDVAQAIASRIQVRLTPEDQARLGRARAAKSETIEAYLRGMKIWWQWSVGNDVTDALRCFQKAIDTEPDYAPAHAGISLFYIFSSTWNNVGLWSPREGVSKGKKAAQKAIALDPMLADGYVAMGFARMVFDWDWTGAEKDFRQALDLDPRSQLALDAYANFLLCARGRLDDAVAMIKRALSSDPLSPALYSDLGVFYYMSGQFDQAIPCFRKTLELDSHFFWARLSLGWTYLMTGNTKEALAEFQNAVQLAPESPYPQQALGYAYGVTGHRDEALHVLASLGRLAETRYVPPSARAYIYIGLGQKDDALDWLEKACAERDTEMIFLKGVVEPPFAPLRNEPRFQALLKKVGPDK